METIWQRLFPGQQLYIKGREHPVSVVESDESDFIVKDHKNELLDFSYKELGHVVFFSKDLQTKVYASAEEYFQCFLEKERQDNQASRPDDQYNEKVCSRCACYEVDCGGRDRICDSFEPKYTPSPEEREQWAKSRIFGYEPEGPAEFSW